MPRSATLLKTCQRYLLALCCLVVCGTAASPTRAQSSQDPIYVFHTTLGNINVQLYPDVTPQTVANFLTYVNSGAYNSSFFHRSVANFIIQGGGYTVDASSTIYAITQNAPVTNEFHISNTRGTIAMAKVGSDPNSATNQWFFNTQDNSANLDNQNGGFTVFGKVVDSSSLAVMDAIAAVPVYDESGGNSSSPFTSLPLVNYTNHSATPVQSNFVRITSIAQPWTGTSVAVGGDGLTRLLWDNTDTRNSVWTLNGTNVTSTPILQPGTGWSAKDVSLDTQNNTHVLWTNADGRMTVWTITKTNAISSLPIFQPGGGWAAQALSMDTQGNAHVLWFNSDGRMAVWTITPQGTATSTAIYQPGSGWGAVSLVVDGQGSARVLWYNTDGRMAVWTITSGGRVTSSSIFQPGGGWQARKVSVDGGGSSHVLWFNPDGRMSVWSIDGSNGVKSTPIFTPGSGWSAVGLCVDGAGSNRVLWDNVDGRTAVWTITAGGSVTSTPFYQP